MKKPIMKKDQGFSLLLKYSLVFILLIGRYSVYPNGTTDSSKPSEPGNSNTPTIPSEPITTIIFDANTYQSDTITETDVQNWFTEKSIEYLEQYGRNNSTWNFSQYFVSYGIYSDPNEQNYAARLLIQSIEYSWGTVLHIRYAFSNGWITLRMSSTEFSVSDNPSLTLITFRNGTFGRSYVCRSINAILSTCGEESASMARRHNRTSSFDFVPFR